MKRQQVDGLDHPEIAINTEVHFKSQGPNITQLNLLDKNSLEDSQNFSPKKRLSKMPDSPNESNLII